MNAAFFEVERLSLSFGGVKAVRDVSFSIRAGEILAVIGPNGAGKTSLLNLITRVFDASSGSIRFNGQDILRLARHNVVRQGIARTFQNIELFEGATVLENLLLGRHRANHGNFFSQMFNLPAVQRAEALSRERVEDRGRRHSVGLHDPAPAGGDERKRSGARPARPLCGALLS